MATKSEIKFFTVEEANRTLPLVRRIVADILQEQGRLAHGESETGEADRRVREYEAELQQLGCLFRGHEGGVVDFYSYRHGRPIFLCWRHGEREIRYWHETDGDLSSRKPLVTSALPSG